MTDTLKYFDSKEIIRLFINHFEKFLNQVPYDTCDTHYAHDGEANISPSREPSNSHQVGLQYKFFSHVHRMRSGLFYEATSENSTELDEVGGK